MGKFIHKFEPGKYYHTTEIFDGNKSQWVITVYLQDGELFGKDIWSSIDSKLYTGYPLDIFNSISPKDIIEIDPVENPEYFL